LEYRKLHGRTYQNFKDVEYWAPNDEKQNEGLDLVHHMLYLAHDNKLYLSPLKNPQKVIDVGTGTGIWAIDFADEFPSADVIGTDLSPIQPAWAPPNCSFQLDDASLDWTFPDNTFDFIHIRCLIGCMKDWVKVYRECYRCLKPGGWLEHTDFGIRGISDDNSLPEGCAWDEWSDLFLEAGVKMGQTFQIVDNDEFVGWMKEAGFPDDVHLHKTKLPVGNWPADPKWKEVGIMNRITTEDGLEGYALYICTKVLGWEYNECQLLLTRVRQALRNKSYHPYYRCNTAYVQKPETESS